MKVKVRYQIIQYRFNSRKVVVNNQYKPSANIYCVLLIIILFQFIPNFRRKVLHSKRYYVRFYVKFQISELIDVTSLNLIYYKKESKLREAFVNVCFYFTFSIHRFVTFLFHEKLKEKILFRLIQNMYILCSSI